MPEQKCIPFNPDLLDALEMGEFDIARRLIDHNEASVHALDDKGDPLLHIILNGVLVIDEDLPDIISFLASYHYDFDAKDLSGAAALHLAAETQPVIVVQALIDCGATINLIDDSLALSTDELREDISAYHGPYDLALIRSQGYDALYIAVDCDNDAVVDCLIGNALQHDISLNLNAALNKAAKKVFDDNVIFRLLDLGADPAYPDQNGMTSLSFTSFDQIYHHALIDRLLSLPKNALGRLANVQDIYGCNSLHHLADCDVSPEQIKLLLDAGANLEAMNKDGETPVIKAIVKENYNLVEIYLRHGARDAYETETSKIDIYSSKPASCPISSHQFLEWLIQGQAFLADRNTNANPQNHKPS